MVTITFSNGLVIEADTNGTCYITDSKPDFPDDLSNVIISDGTSERILHHVELINCFPFDERYWFGLYELSPEEIYRLELNTERDMMLDLIADQEYRLCLIDLGVL